MRAPSLGVEAVPQPLRRVMRKRIFWPLATLALLLLFSLATNPHFFAVTIRDGHLYGSLVDILNRASPLMIIAMGLTLVIATHGIDISVGAVVAIPAAVAASANAAPAITRGDPCVRPSRSPAAPGTIRIPGFPKTFAAFGPGRSASRRRAAPS